MNIKKLVSIVKKAFIEQARSMGLLITTLLTAPFFVLIYFILTAGTGYQNKVLVLSDDTGIYQNSIKYELNYTDSLISELNTTMHLLSASKSVSLDMGMELLKAGKAELLVVLPDNFSAKIIEQKYIDSLQTEIAFYGNQSSFRYLMTSVWVHDIISKFVFKYANIKSPIHVTETAVAASAYKTDFDLQVPGLIIFSIIMLMYTASAALIRDIEAGTFRLMKLARVSVFQYVTGNSLVQLTLGIIGVLLAILTAVLLGFQLNSAWWLVLLTCVLTAVSIIAFSILIAAFVNNISQVVIAGTLPLFIFMFFSGAMFPVNTPLLFNIGTLDVYLNSILSPAFAVSALTKLLVMNAHFTSILPELTAIAILTLIYAILGSFFFRRKHHL